MFRFIIGVLVGVAAARLLRTERVDTKAVEEGFSELQKRAEAMLIESRQVLAETRQELSAALEASRVSVQEKAGRIKIAVTEPEQVVGRYETGENVDTPRPSKLD